jgi:general stress protein YciG
MTSQHNQSGRSDQQNQAGSAGQQSAGGSGGRGFAGMDRERQREIASQGGRAAHASGNAHQFTSEEARAAGSKRHANNASRNASASTDATPARTASGDASLS